jgi:hypothetical protein
MMILSLHLHEFNENVITEIQYQNKFCRQMIKNCSYFLNTLYPSIFFLLQPEVTAHASSVKQEISVKMIY